MSRTPFRVIQPARSHIPVVIEVPHAGLALPATVMASMPLPVRVVARDADLYVDELVDGLDEQGAWMLVSGTSRLCVDLNRARNDYDGSAVKGGPNKQSPHGVIWREGSEGERVLFGPISKAELNYRMKTFFDPYHQALDQLVGQVYERFGVVILLSVHSMPSIGMFSDRADVVIGVRSGTTAAASLVRLVERDARAWGWTTAIDDPYSGGEITARVGDPSRGRHAIQVELARRLYMSETTLERHEPAMVVTRSFLQRLVANLGQAAVGSLRNAQ